MALAQRLLPRRSVARTAGQERQPFLEPRQQRRRREDPYPCRRQLDRQRQPVQPPADLRHRRGVLRRKGEPGPDRLRPLDEEPHRFVVEELFRRGRIHGRQRQRRHRVLALGPQPERQPAGGQHSEGRGGREQLADEGRGRNDLLEVVQHQEQPLACQCLAYRLRRRPSRRFPQSQRIRHRRGH